MPTGPDCSARTPSAGPLNFPNDTLLPSAPFLVQRVVGGVLIGVAASLLWVLNGRRAGVSGIVGGTLRAAAGDHAWRAFFIGGLVIGGLALSRFAPASFAGTASTHSAVIGAAGILVGFGTRLGNGCTSGHGICGLARGSLRSLVATLTFMGAGGVTVFVVYHLVGASL